MSEMRTALNNRVRGRGQGCFDWRVRYRSPWLMWLQLLFLILLF